MQSTHQCVKEIQDILTAGDAVTKEKVAELVWAYAQACKELNEKAQRCLDLLRQGRRAEAVRLAKDPPDLEQELGLLDFPQRGEWLDLCEGAGLPIGQGLDTAALGGIVQEVYSEGGELDRLLRSFRRMSLGHAPLADRLRIVRWIWKADPQPDVWIEDVRAFEKARLAELIEEAEDADVRGDLPGLERVLAEVRSDEWLSRHDRLVAAIDKLAQPHRQRYAGARFAEVAKDLHEAHAGMDEQRCRFLMEQWEAVVREFGVQPTASMEAEVAPVEDWLGQIDATRQEDAALNAACAALELAIDEENDRHTLEQLAGAVFRLERGMPEVLAARFKTRMEELDRRARRRFALRLTAVVGSILLVAAVLAVVVILQTRRSERGRWQTEIAAALEKGDLEGTGKLLASLSGKNAEVYATPEIQALQRAYDQKVQEEAARLTQLKEAQKAVEQGGVGNPDKTALGRAKELARTLEEKQWAEDWRQKYEKAGDDLRRQGEDAFREKLKQLKTLHADFSRAETARSDDLDKLAAPCLALAKELQAVADAPPSLMAEAAAIERHVLQAVKTFQDSAGERKAAQSDLGRLPALAEDANALATALEAFVKGHPSHPLSADFAKAVGMAPHWRAANAWRTLTEGWGGQARALDAATIAPRRQQVDEYLKAHPGGPFEGWARQYQAYLDSVVAAFPAGQLVGLEKVREVLTHPVFTPGLQMIRARDGRRFYVLRKDLQEQRASDKVVGYNLAYLTSENMTTGTISISTDQIVEGPTQAPQSVFAEAALLQLVDWRKTGWETFYLRLAVTAQHYKDVDPVLTAQVLQLLLGFAAKSTPYKGEPIKQLEGKFNSENLGLVAWLDPSSDTAGRARSKAEGLLKTIGSLQAMIDEVEKSINGMAVPTCRPVGIMLGDAERVRFSRAPADGKPHVLWSKPGEAPQFLEIGMIRGGKLEGSKDLTNPYPQGTPVYFLGR
jgi:hypothetical protein